MNQASPMAGGMSHGPGVAVGTQRRLAESQGKPLPLARAGDGAFSRERGHARRVACGWDASRDGRGGRWEPIHRGLTGIFSLRCAAWE